MAQTEPISLKQKLIAEYIHKQLMLFLVKTLIFTALMATLSGLVFVGLVSYWLAK